MPGSSILKVLPMNLLAGLHWLAARTACMEWAKQAKGAVLQMAV